eukprot:934194-Prymnesium_polylepis.1
MRLASSKEFAIAVDPVVHPGRAEHAPHERLRRRHHGLPEPFLDLRRRRRVAATAQRLRRSRLEGQLVLSPKRNTAPYGARAAHCTHGERQTSRDGTRGHRTRRRDAHAARTGRARRAWSMNPGAHARKALQPITTASACSQSAAAAHAAIDAGDTALVCSSRARPIVRRRRTVAPFASSIA